MIEVVMRIIGEEQEHYISLPAVPRATNVIWAGKAAFAVRCVEFVAGSNKVFIGAKQIQKVVGPSPNEAGAS